jgi:hypothetical protein
MKNIKTILTVIAIFLLYSFANAQGKCQGGTIRVYKGASGCGCHCLKECVTPEELPVYLENGWNTIGCWNCCFGKNWVDAGEQKTFRDIHQTDQPGTITASLPTVSESDVKISVMDMTGRFVETAKYLETEDHELIWDQTGLSTGMYILNVQAGNYSENKIVSVVN